MTPNFLLLEDEETVGATVSERLTDSGYSTIWCKTIQEAKAAVSRHKFDLSLLDVNLPDGNGMDFAIELRKEQPTCAIVFLTAMGTPEDRVRGFESGAEDYIVKPFHFRELQVRIENVLKRAQFLQNRTNENQKVKVGKAIIDFSAYTISDDVHFGSLTHKECALMKLLFERKGQVVSRDDILNLIWSKDEFPTPRTVDNFIMKLRRWIEPNAEQPTVIKSIRGIGYQLNEQECQETS